MKNFFKYNKEYESWKKAPSLTGKDLSKSMENIQLSQEQMDDGERLKTNMFKTLYKVDSNTQKHSSKIDFVREAVKFPITLVLGSLGSVFSMKYLVQLRNATVPKDIFKASAKYLGIISFE